MDYLIIALVLFGSTAIASALLGLLPQNSWVSRWTNVLGAAGVVLGCIVGFGVFLSPVWMVPLKAVLPWGLPIGSGSIGIDPLSALFLIPVFGVGIVCAISGVSTLKDVTADNHNNGAYWMAYALLLLGMTLVITARDAVLFLLAWEIMSVSPFFMLNFNDKDRKSRDASWIYLIMGHIGAMFLYVLFAILWGQSGGTSFAGFADLPHTALTPLVFLTALIGFGAKADMAPMHVWLPEAYPAAPGYVCGILSGAMSNAGLYGIFRTFDFMGPLPEFSAWWGWILLAVGVGTGFVGIMKAMSQSNIKRMLAYSSVENMGIMLAGAGAGIIGLVHSNMWIAALGFGASLFHMLNHSAFKSLLFLCVNEIQIRTGTTEMSQLGGLRNQMPIVAVFFALGSAAIACLPPLNGFCSELVLALSLARGTALFGVENQLGLLFALTVIALISGCAAVTFTKAYGIGFLGMARSKFAENLYPPHRVNIFAMAVPAACCVAVAFAAPVVFEYVSLGVSTVIGADHLQLWDALASLESMKDTLAVVVKIESIAVIAVVCLLILRRILIGRKEIRRTITWSCGYRFGTPRIQYTDASFSEPMDKIFGSAMGVQMTQAIDQGGHFPKEGHQVIKIPSRLLTYIYTPLFERCTDICHAAKILQHGRIHLYILYILITVVILLVWTFTGGEM